MKNDEYGAGRIDKQLRLSAGCGNGRSPSTRKEPIRKIRACQRGFRAIFPGPEYRRLGSQSDDVRAVAFQFFAALRRVERRQGFSQHPESNNYRPVNPGAGSSGQFKSAYGRIARPSGIRPDQNPNKRRNLRKSRNPAGRAQRIRLGGLAPGPNDLPSRLPSQRFCLIVYLSFP